MEGIRFGTGLNTWCAGLLKNRQKNLYMIVESIESVCQTTFEMYLPVYSSNGWEMRQDNYNEKNPLYNTLS
jgi:hypothetical protein